MHVVEIVCRPVGVEIAARKYRADQRRPQFGCGRVELVDISVLGRTQDVESAAKGKILWILGPAVRRVEDQRHFSRLRVAAPQRSGNFEAHAVKLVGCGDAPSLCTRATANRLRARCAPGEFRAVYSSRKSTHGPICEQATKVAARNLPSRRPLRDKVGFSALRPVVGVTTAAIRCKMAGII